MSPALPQSEAPADIRPSHVLIQDVDAMPRCLITASEMPDEECMVRGRKRYPFVGGRLRAFRQDWGAQGGIVTEWLDTGDLAVCKATVYGGGEVLATATGTSPERGFENRETKFEMAETRAIGRALRFAGYGVDGTSAEEMGEHTESMNPPRAASRTAKTTPSGAWRDEPVTEQQLGKIRSLARQQGLDLGLNDIPETKGEAADLISKLSGSDGE